MTDKGKSSTDKFYIVRIKNHGFDTRRRPISGVTDLDRVLWWHAGNDGNSLPLPKDIDALRIAVQTDSETGNIELHAEWKVTSDVETVALSDVATLTNGQSITEKDVISGPYPVIAGGAGKVPYYHNEFNRDGQVITDKDRVFVKFNRHAHNSELRNAGYVGSQGKIPWLHHRTLFLEYQ